MRLREKIVREAFAKKDVKPLLSHLKAITLGSDEIDALASLLKRGCLPLYEYPNAKGEADRENAIAQIVAIIEASAPIGAADEVKAVLALFQLIESGYRAILEDLAGLPSASLTPQRRISALFDLCAQRRDSVRAASMDAIIVDGMIDPIGLGVADGHGNVVSPDVPIDVDVVTLTMALKMEAFQQGWFNAAGQLELASRIETTPDEREAVRPLLNAAQAWRHWTWIQEETRYFDGTLTDVPSSEFPQEYHDAGVTRFLHHVPGSAEWHVIDLAANERLHLRIKQEAAQMVFGTDAAKRVKGVSDKVPLLPDAFVSIEELQSAQTLDHALSISIATDMTQYRGLRLVEWLRGYATLQELVVAPYEAGDHRPDLLLVEFERADLIKRLQRVGLAGAKADSFINLASFDKGTRDLFDTPVLCCGSKKVLLYGFSRNFGADHAMIRARSSSRPARPYIERFMSLSLLILPSTGPVLQGNVNAARTASMSRRRPRANEPIALSSASVSHGSSALISRPTRILWNRRVRSAACAISGDAARTASTNRASSPWRVSLGAVRSRAACRDDGGLQRRSAPDRAAGCAWPSRNRTLIQRRKLRTSPT
jgi:hypothetical protein